MVSRSFKNWLTLDCLTALCPTYACRRHVCDQTRTGDLQPAIQAEPLTHIEQLSHAHMFLSKKPLNITGCFRVNGD